MVWPAPPPRSGRGLPSGTRCTRVTRMGRFVLRGPARGRAAGVLALAGLMFSCTTQGPVGQSGAALAAARVAPSDSFGETLDLAGLQDRFATVAQRIAPSVVAISATEATFSVDAALRAD